MSQGYDINKGIDIKNFIPEYPDEDDPELIEKITEQKEFYINRLSPDEKVSRIAGKPLSHQYLQARYFSQHTPFMKGVLWHGLGSGKSCSASLIVEEFKNTIVDGKPRKRALILVKNNHLKESFRNEISTVCTREIYFPKLRVEELRAGKNVEMTEETKRRRLNAAIAETYEIVTYSEVLDPKKMDNEKAIEEKYSGRVIIVDEIHNIRLQPGKSKNIQYKLLHKFLHIVKGCRVILLTATPIWDKVYDIAGLMNLILKKDEQLPTLSKFIREFFDSDKNLRKDKAEELRQKFKGKISYIRSLISTARRTEVGIKEPWMKWIKIFPTQLSNMQKEAIDSASGGFNVEDSDKEDSEEEELEEDDDSVMKKGAFLSSARDASNCVYPIFDKKGNVISTGYGTDTFKKYAITTEDKFVFRKGDVSSREKIKKEVFKFKDNRIAKELGPVEGDDIYKNLRKYSSKFAELIEILKNPDTMGEKAFIYNDSVRGTGGVISLALILELYGFRWIKNVNGIPKKGKEITPKSPGNFIVITSDDQTISESSQIREALAKYNNINNLGGNNIRIIIGSSTISQGFSLKSTRQGHIISGYWNLPSIDQAMGRIYRVGAFDLLPQKDRHIKFYKYTSMEKGNDVEFNGKSYSSKHTIDSHIYSIAENKEYENSQIYRIMKEMSWDCALAYARNVLPNDQDYSRECDFIKCNYKCDNFSPTNKKGGGEFMEKSKKGKAKYIYSYTLDKSDILTSNYNLLYAQEKTDKIIKELKNLFGNYFNLRIDVIIKKLDIQQDEIPVLLGALNYMINKKVVIKDRFGSSMYLKESYDTYFLDSSFSVKSSFESNDEYQNVIYTMFPMISERSSLGVTVETIQLKDDQEKIKDFMKNPTIERFEKISHKGKIIIFEQYYVHKYVKGGKDSKALEIIKKLSEKEVYEMSDGNYIHYMYNARHINGVYGTYIKDLKPNGMMRILNLEEGDWVYIHSLDMNESRRKLVEENYKKEAVKYSSDKIKAGVSSNPYNMHGIEDNGRFKIYDNRIGKAASGRVCETYKVPELRDMFYHLSHTAHDDEISPAIKEMSREKLLSSINANPKTRVHAYVQEINEDTTTEQIRKIYTMLTFGKNQLCSSLQRWFKGENQDGKKYYVTI